MQLPPSLVTVTPLSKILALALFVSLPFIGFYLGIKYQPVFVSTNKDTFMGTLPSVKSSPTDTPSSATTDFSNPSNWLSFNDTHFEYSIKIPPSWKVRMDPDYSVVRIAPESVISNEYVSILTLSRYPNLSGNFVKSTVNINGQQVDRYEGPGMAPGQTALGYYIKGNDDNYFSLGANFTSSNTELKNIMEDIISTFQFPIPYSMPTPVIHYPGE